MDIVKGKEKDFFYDHFMEKFQVSYNFVYSVNSRTQGSWASCMADDTKIASTVPGIFSH